MQLRCPICCAVQEAAATTAHSRGERVECPDCGYAWDGEASDGSAPLTEGRPSAAINVDAASERLAPPPLELTKPKRARLAGDGLARGPLSRRLKAFGAIAACLIVSMGLVSRRETVVRAIPGSASVFAAMGLPANLRGLALRNVRSKLLDDGGQRVLAVEGDIANLRSKSGKLPDLLVLVRSDDGRVVYSWTSPASQKEIAVGETIYFRARLAAPPLEGKDVKVQFASIDVKTSPRAK
jgi:hypothetical protein